MSMLMIDLMETPVPTDFQEQVVPPATSWWRRLLRAYKEDRTLKENLHLRLACRSASPSSRRWRC